MLKYPKKIPLAYFITFTCYGTWLHGERITSVDRCHNLVGTEFLGINKAREKCSKNRMKQSPYLLNHPQQRQIALNAIQEACNYRAWTLLAAHVRTNHIHLVIHATDSPENILGTIKAYISRKLNECEPSNKNIQRWTRHGSTKYLWKNSEIESTIQYVIDEQGDPMAVFENKTRTFKTPV